MTQSEMVLKYIDDFGSITQLEALNDLGIMRLASRVSDLRKSGIRLDSRMEAVKNRYCQTVYVKRYFRSL
jgi:hypothetical protein